MQKLKDDDSKVLTMVFLNENKLVEFESSKCFAYPKFEFQLKEGSNEYSKFLFTFKNGLGLRSDGVNNLALKGCKLEAKDRKNTQLSAVATICKY